MSRLGRAATVAACCLAMCWSAAAVRAQSFQNLNFETVVTDGTVGALGEPFVVDVPGWTFSDIDPPQRFFHLGSLPQQFLTTSQTAVQWQFAQVLEGQHSLAMAAGYIGPNFDIPSGPWIEQAGVVPAGTKSVRLKATSRLLFQFPPPDPQSYVGPFAWNLTLNGLDVPLVELPNGDFSGDATAFANALSTLRIDVNENYPSPAGVWDITLLVDEIRFSPLVYTETPEPTGAALAAIAAAMIVRRRN